MVMFARYMCFLPALYYQQNLIILDSGCVVVAIRKTFFFKVIVKGIMSTITLTK